MSRPSRPVKHQASLSQPFTPRARVERLAKSPRSWCALAQCGTGLLSAQIERKGEGSAAANSHQPRALMLRGALSRRGKGHDMQRRFPGRTGRKPTNARVKEKCRTCASTRSACGTRSWRRPNRRHAQGRHQAADAVRRRQAGTRLVQGAMRGARLHGRGRRGRQHVRAPAGPATTRCRRSPWARISTRSRPAASSTACSACWARSKRCARSYELGYETNAPIEIVNWTNEEGSRFAPAMLCSGVFAGVFTPDYAYARADRDGKTFGDELARIGYRGQGPAGGRKFGAMFELHIEQGPILEAEAKDDRRRARRAGHALVRGHRHRPGGAYRRHADAAAQERAAGRGADDRAHPPDRA